MSLLEFCCDAVRKAKDALLNLSVESAVSPAHGYGKEDTLWLDAVPEKKLAEIIKEKYPEAALVSEEESFGDLTKAKIVFFADPLDGSSMLKAFLSKKDDKKMTVRKVLEDGACVSDSRLWESMFGGPFDLTSCCTVLTAVVGGELTCTVFYNYCTGKILYCDRNGFYDGRDYPHPTIKEMVKIFGTRQYEGLTYCGKDAYKENLQKINLPVEARIIEKYSQHATGPMRPMFFYRARVENCNYKEVWCLGFVVSNGEKITEWIHWLLMLPKKIGLKLFEVIDKNCGEVRGVPTAARDASESIFREESNGFRLDFAPLAKLKRPAEYRATLVICDESNDLICNWAAERGHRQVWFYE